MNQVVICANDAKLGSLAQKYVRLLGEEAQVVRHGHCDTSPIVIKVVGGEGSAEAGECGLRGGTNQVITVGGPGLRLPQEAAEFLRCVDAALHVRNGKIVAVVGSRGGVGTSSVALMVARKLGAVVVDGNDPPALSARLGVGIPEDGGEGETGQGVLASHAIHSGRSTVSKAGRGNKIGSADRILCAVLAKESAVRHVQAVAKRVDYVVVDAGIVGGVVAGQIAEVADYKIIVGGRKPGFWWHPQVGMPRQRATLRTLYLVHKMQRLRREK
ncbi:MAG: hypothetical protein Q4A71_05315 [Actinomycetaceae bacterium]|nr:hypothetical protein [Actinomycetaceae bacterium]